MFRGRRIPKINLPDELPVTFDSEERVFFTRLWQPVEEFGIQPSGNGIQVYSNPQGWRGVRDLGKLLIEVSKRMQKAQP